MRTKSLEGRRSLGCSLSAGFATSADMRNVAWNGSLRTVLLLRREGSKYQTCGRGVSFMRGFLSALASQILLLTLTSSGQTAPLASSDKNAKQPEPCRVSGQVVGAADGASLKSARVALIQEDERSDPLVFGATSDGDGHFDIKNVAPG